MADDKRCGTCGFFSVPEAVYMPCDAPVPAWVDGFVINRNRLVGRGEGTDCPCWKPREEKPVPPTNEMTPAEVARDTYVSYSPDNHCRDCVHSVPCECMPGPKCGLTGSPVCDTGSCGAFAEKGEVEA